MSRIPGQAAGKEFDSATRGIMPEHAVSRLHLLRHGEVAKQEERLVRGQLDVGLSDAGLEQSSRLARWLINHEGRPDALVGSDLTRCRVLGDELASLAGLDYEATSTLREQDMGDWQGQTWSAVTEREPGRVTAYWDDYANVAPPGGESFADLVARVAAWWDEEWSARPGRTLWVSTHVGVIRALSCHLLGIAPGEALRLAPATASHTAYLVSGAGAVLSCFGERPWLFGEANR
ncbi:MAG: histidine phosphatase family protein [Planctomycetota bacterium]